MHSSVHEAVGNISNTVAGKTCAVVGDVAPARISRRNPTGK